MEFVGLALFLIWLAGALYVSVQLRRRAGIQHHRRIDFARDGVGPLWVVKSAVLTVFWPITVVLWRVRS